MWLVNVRLIFGASYNWKQFLKSVSYFRQCMILGCNTWDFLVVDAHEPLRQKAGVFSVSDMLIITWQSADPFCLTMAK